MDVLNTSFPKAKPYLIFSAIVSIFLFLLVVAFLVMAIVALGFWLVNYSRGTPTK